MDKILLNYQLESHHKKLMEQYHKELLEIVPGISFEDAQKIFDKTISFRQSNVSSSGKIFEDYVQGMIEEYTKNYHPQYCIGNYVVDFMLGNPEDDISKQILISCKLTCRERYKQDSGLLSMKPKAYFLIVDSEDYPRNFVDNEFQKMFVISNRKGDKRLTFEDFENTLFGIFHKITFVDLCCGIGSFHYSLKNVHNNSECILANDILKCARETYKMNYHVEPSQDIRDTDYSKITADIVFSGNPCQSFSQIGKRDGLEDSRGDLFNYIIENVLGTRSFKIAVFENVEGLLTHDSGKTFSKIIKGIESKGYSVLYRKLLCSEFGIPQNRKRVFIICFRDDLEHDEEMLNRIIEKHRKTITLSEYLEKDFVRDTAFTIRCGGASSPIDSKQNWDGYYLKNGEEYRLKIDDMKKLQGFPNDFQLIGSKTECQRMLGNTIPTNLSEIVCEYVTEMLRLEMLIKSV